MNTESLIFKRAITEKRDDIDTSKLIIRSVISTQTPDHAGDVCVPAGCVLDIFATNPIVLLNHGQQYPVPIAQAVKEDGSLGVEIYDDVVVSSSKFVESDPTSMQIFRLNAEGIMKGWSVGFKPIPGEMEPIAARGGKNSWLYRKWLMVEYSAVGVPMNPEALTIAVEKSMIGGERMTDPVKQYLEPWRLPLKGFVTSGFERKSMENPDKEGVENVTIVEDTTKKEPEKEEKKAKSDMPMKPSQERAMNWTQAVRDLLSEVLVDSDEIENPAIVEAAKVLSAHLGEAEEIIKTAMAEAYPDMEYPERPSDDELKSACMKRRSPEVDVADEEYEDEGMVEVKGFNFRPRRFVMKAATSKQPQKLPALAAYKAKKGLTVSKDEIVTQVMTGFNKVIGAKK